MQKDDRITEAGTTADSDMQPIVTTSASIAASPVLAEVPAVKVKLLTFWMMDKEFDQRKPDEHMISCGVWQTKSVHYDEREHQRGHRYYELVCCWPMHRDLKVGDTRRMYEDVILALCHPVEITHLPKIVR